jgi:hypothetical protein
LAPNPLAYLCFILSDFAWLVRKADPDAAVEWFVLLPDLVDIALFLLDFGILGHVCGKGGLALPNRRPERLTSGIFEVVEVACVDF